MEQFSLHDPLSHAMRLHERRFSREGISITVEIPVDLPLLWGVADQIEQVFLNILVNAWHAMPHGGTLTITAGETQDAAILITFQDTGTGMSADALEKAFAPFYSTKGEKGTGLGLAICKQIIDHHRGSIRLASRPDAGTTVSMTLKQAETSP